MLKEVLQKRESDKIKLCVNLDNLYSLTKIENSSQKTERACQAK